MDIVEAAFENEAELDRWAQENIGRFLSGAIFLSPFRIETPSGKGGIPDGFAFNLADRQWFIVEAELLKHGVWPHIAEQISRFVVAVRSPIPSDVYETNCSIIS